jgi:hypothetical protein
MSPQEGDGSSFGTTNLGAGGYIESKKSVMTRVFAIRRGSEGPSTVKFQPGVVIDTFAGAATRQQHEEKCNDRSADLRHVYLIVLY